MALTAKQADAIIKLFAKTFVNSTCEKERKVTLRSFEDAFGKSIMNWQMKCREEICKSDTDEGTINCYDALLDKTNDDLLDSYEIRLFEASDLNQVRELINVTFHMGLIEEDDDKFNAFINSGYSVVAVCGEEICGVALAYEVPELSKCTLYLDTFAVAESLRNCGIGKKMLKHIQAICREKKGRGVNKIKLQTDRNIEAYQIYKHWGFGETELTHMQLYFI